MYTDFNIKEHPITVTQVIFMERNGLRHGEFPLSLHLPNTVVSGETYPLLIGETYSETSPASLSFFGKHLLNVPPLSETLWNAGSNVLAVVYDGKDQSHVMLYTCTNYSWQVRSGVGVPLLVL